MTNFDKTLAFRPKPNELEYLNTYWNGSFTNYVRNSIKNDIKKIQKNRKSNFFKDMSQTIVMLGLGAIFVLFSLNINNFMGFLLVFLLGIYFMVHSLISVFMEVRKKWKKTNS